MISNRPAVSRHLSEGIGSLAARVRIAGTIRSQGDGLTDSSRHGGSPIDVPLVGPGTFLVAAYLDAALRGRGTG